MGGRNEWDEEESTTETRSGLLSREKKGKPAELEQIEGPGAPRLIPLLEMNLIVGRAPGREIQISSAEVSRQHMLLRRSGKEYYCEDLKSRAGVFLNGIKIHSAALREGDTIQLGNALFVYHEGS